MPTPDLPKVEAAIVQLTNVFRKEQGLAAVQPNPVLRKAAEDFARYLARTNTFSHTADGRQPGERAKAGGYDFCIVSENLPALTVIVKKWSVEMLTFGEALLPLSASVTLNVAVPLALSAER